MFVSGGGGGGHFVGLAPGAAASLVTAMGSAGGRASEVACRVGGLLTEAGANALGASTPATLRGIEGWLAQSHADVRWRVALLSADSGAAVPGQMLTGYLPFATAAEARAVGQQHAAQMEAALWRHVRGEGAEADAALDEYLSLMRPAAVWGDDPAWAGGFVNGLGSGGLSNVVWIAQTQVQGDVPASRTLLAPVAAALAMAMRNRTADPALAGRMLRWTNYSLGVLLTSAPPETDFLVAAAKTRFVDAAWNEDRSDDLHADEAAFFLQALAEDAEASYRVLTSTGPAGERAVVDVLAPMLLLGNPDAASAAGRVLEQGLVVYPQSMGSVEWNEAVASTEVLVRYIGQREVLLREAHPDLARSLLRVLYPHLDAVAVIGSASSGIDPGLYDLQQPLPGGRKTLDVDPEHLRDYLGNVLQSKEAVAAMQAIVASYAQSDGAVANRLPLIEPDGRVADLEPFMADSLRIAGMVGVMGQGLEIAGHDEETRTKLLTGAVGLASDNGIGKVIGWTGPLGWAAKATAGRGAAWATDRFSEWVATFEPVEGEEGVDAFLESFDATTEASLRQQMAADPRLAQLPLGQQDEIVAHALRISGDMVRANLLEVYATMTGETAGEQP